MRSWAASAAGLLVLTLFYAFGSIQLAPTAALFTAQVVLYAICVLAFIALGVFGSGARDAATWLTVASYAALFAAIFYGANGALDALHGPHRPGPDVDQSLGGLTLWFALCPGAASVALGKALCTAIRGSSRRPDRRARVGTRRPLPERC